MGTDIDINGLGHRFDTSKPVRFFDSVSQVFKVNIRVRNWVKSLQDYVTVFEKDYGFEKFFDIEPPHSMYIENLPPDFDYRKVDFNNSIIVDEINKNFECNNGYRVYGFGKNYERIGDPLDLFDVCKEQVFFSGRYRYYTYKYPLMSDCDHEFDTMEFLNEIRREVFDFSKLIGFNKAVYYEDQGSESILWEKLYMPQKEFLEYLRSKEWLKDYCKGENETEESTKERLEETVIIDLPDYITGKRPLLPKGKYAGPIIDDFRDLR